MLKHIHTLSEGKEKDSLRLSNEPRVATSKTSTVTLKDSPEHRHLDATWRMEQLGTEDASSIMQERLKMVIEEYRKRGWDIPETIMLKQMILQPLKGSRSSGQQRPQW